MKAKMMYMFGLLAAFTLTACSDNESEPSIVRWKVSVFHL